MIARRVRCFVGMALVWLAGLMLASAQDWTYWNGAQGHPQLRVMLRDKEQYARIHTANVEVEVQNVWLHWVTAVSDAGIPTGVLAYQLDHCAPVVTTETRVRFEQLSKGDHSITVTLLGLDDKPIAPKVRLQLTIP